MILELVVLFLLPGRLTFLPGITWLSCPFGPACVMTSERAEQGTTVDFVNIASEGSVPPSEDAQTFKYLCCEVCAYPEVSRVCGCGKGEILRVHTKFVRLGR